MLSGDRRAVLEAIAYGSDPKLAPGDRLRALEALREYEREDPNVAGLSTEEIEAELDGYFSAMIALLFIGSADLDIDASKFPKTAGRLREVVGSMVELAIENDDLARQRAPRPEPEPEPDADEDAIDATAVEVPEPVEGAALASGAARRELPRGIDPSLGWTR